MDVNKKVIDTLSVLGHPVVFLNYTGAASTYITFNYEDDRAEFYADDGPEIDVAYLMIHLFTPGDFNFMALKKQIRSKLFKAGFTYPQVDSFYEEDTKINHVVFRCQIDGSPESEEI